MRNVEHRVLAGWGAIAAMVLGLGSAAMASNGGQQTLISDEELTAVLAAERARVGAVEKVYDTVVAIYGMSRQGGGSGVLFHPDGYALTNYHVVRAAGVRGKGGLADGKLYDWKLVGIDPGGDLAIIKLGGRKKFPYASLGNSETVRVGDFVMAMGNPFVLAEDQKPTVTLGIVSGIKRYQPGAGPLGNMLEYGNCIQIDSSINPGNSGGPLFNMSGEVIGINGRGSFEERGRVNVGVGYAISAEQCKNFIPDLLATKLTQHGTLDAVFGTREYGVICETINLDSPLGKAGMRPGHILVSIEGVPIKTANQVKNEVSIYPANWPVEVVWKQEGRERRTVVRLTPMPYGPTTKKVQQQPAPQPDPGQPRRVEVRPPQNNMGQPGEIREPKTAAEQAIRVLSEWRGFAGGKDLRSIQGLAMQQSIEERGETKGERALLLMADGRGAAQSPVDAIGEEVELAGLLMRSATAKDLDVTLMGGDKAAGRRAYRVLLKDGDDRYVLWFSLLDDGEQRFETRLLKVARADADGTEHELAVMFDHYRDVDGCMMPVRMRVVRGLAEEVQRSYSATHGEWVQSKAKADDREPEAGPTETEAEAAKDGGQP